MAARNERAGNGAPPTTRAAVPSAGSWGASLFRYAHAPTRREDRNFDQRPLDARTQPERSVRSERDEARRRDAAADAGGRPRRSPNRPTRGSRARPRRGHGPHDRMTGPGASSPHSSPRCSRCPSSSASANIPARTLPAAGAPTSRSTYPVSGLTGFFWLATAVRRD